MLSRHDLIRDEDLHLIDAVLAPGYGKMNAATWDAMQSAVQLEALFLDPVYTGKSMAGLIHLVRERVLPRGAKVLFVHTGGQPALFGYEAVLQEWMDPALTDPASPLPS